MCVYIGKEPEEQVFRTPPLLVIEILSKDDRLRDLEDKVRDYLEFSVPYVWVIDPAARLGYIYTREGKKEAAEGVLKTDNPSIKLDLRVLFLVFSDAHANAGASPIKLRPRSSTLHLVQSKCSSIEAIEARHLDHVVEIIVIEVFSQRPAALLHP